MDGVADISKRPRMSVFLFGAVSFYTLVVAYVAINLTTYCACRLVDRMYGQKVGTKLAK